MAFIFLAECRSATAFTHLRDFADHDWLCNHSLGGLLKPENWLMPSQELTRLSPAISFAMPNWVSQERISRYPQLPYIWF